MSIKTDNFSDMDEEGNPITSKNLSGGQHSAEKIKTDGASNLRGGVNRSSNIA